MQMTKNSAHINPSKKYKFSEIRGKNTGTKTTQPQG
jgi:hypothetical protein